MSKVYARGRPGTLEALTGPVAPAGPLDSPATSTPLPAPAGGATARTHLARPA
ncbi:hypothetical protein ABZ845_02595 [Streptomyces sp. NPDC047022]|uniref:hypothetical protein n=1 Tax=Streptomyces sp. NPDC047022 TaxID=3155737 RepID=UPI0033C8B3DF